MKSAIRLKIVVQTDGRTDRQTDEINFGMYSQRHFEWYMARLPKLKISWRRGKQYTSPDTLGGGINSDSLNSTIQ